MQSEFNSKAKEEQTLRNQFRLHWWVKDFPLLVPLAAFAVLSPKHVKAG